MGYQFAIYLKFTYPSGNQHAVLRAEVDDNNGFTFRFSDRLFSFNRLLAGLLLGNFQVGGYFDIVTGCYTMTFIGGKLGGFPTVSIYKKLTIVIYLRQVV